MKPDLQPGAKWVHLPYTGRCYTCNRPLKYARDPRSCKYYCSMECRRKRPPKMVLAEMAWGQRFDQFALRYLNNGGTVLGLAGLCGISEDVIYDWLKKAGIEKRVIWAKRGNFSLLDGEKGGGGGADA